MVLRHVSILSTLINKNNFYLGINDSFYPDAIIN